jgi:branched-chain amino acid transport system permease protein
MSGSVPGTLLNTCFVFALVIAVNTILGGAWESVSMLFLIAVVAVVGTGIYSGNSGILSFGHVGFMALGAYLSSLFILDKSFKEVSLPELPGILANIHLSPLFGLIAAALVIGVVALPIGLPLSRFTGIAAAIATFALLIVVNSVLIGAQSITHGSQTFYGVPPFTTWALAFGVVIVTLFVARWFRDSDTGLQLRASREDELAARSGGVDVAHARLVAWCVSAVIVAAAGALYAGTVTAFSPKSFYLELTFTYMVMLLFGGWTTVSGAVLGTAVITGITQILQQIQNEGVFGSFFGTPQIGLSVAILAILYLRPSGLLGYVEADTRIAKLIGSWKHKVAPAEDPADERTPDVPADIDKLAQELDPVAGDDMARKRLVGKGVTKEFAGLKALGGVDVELKQGEIVGLIGPNGSGKTTLLNVLTGVLPPTAGSIDIGDVSTLKLPTHKIARLGIARTFQNIRLYRNLSVRDNVTVGISTGREADDRRKTIDDAIKMMDLEGYQDAMAGTLSYGAQRRLEIARALVARPDFLLLDEPAAGMNHAESDELLTVLVALRRDTGIGLLVVDHDLRLMMRLCDRMIVLNEGLLIAAGTPREIEADAKVREAYLGTQDPVASSSQTRKGSE